MELAELKDRAEAIRQQWAPRPSDARFQCLGSGDRGISHGLDRLMRATTKSVWNAQHHVAPYASQLARAKNRETRNRGIDVRGILPPAAVEEFPLIQALIYPLRVGPVVQQTIVVDESIVVLPGPVHTSGHGTAWWTTDSEAVGAVRDLWIAMWEFARPLPRLVLTDRQVDLVLALGEGHTDTTLARLFSLSPRTVSTELGRAEQAFGVCGRTALLGAALGLRTPTNR